MSIKSPWTHLGKRLIFSSQLTPPLPTVVFIVQEEAFRERLRVQKEDQARATEAADRLREERVKELEAEAAEGRPWAVRADAATSRPGGGV